MAYIGKTPPSAALTSSDISDGIIATDKLANNAVVTSKITDGTISNADISSTVITGQTAETSIADGDTILIHDASASALRKMTKANFVSGIGGANTPAFLAHVNSSTQTIANNTTVKITNYNTEIFDTHNAFASGEFTVPSGGAGRYFLSGSISSDTGTQMLAKQFNIQIKAGSTVYASVTILRPPYAQLVISTITQLSEGQTVSMNMYQDSGSTVSLEGGRRTFFGGFRLIS